MGVPMGILREVPPTAGFPLYARDIFSSLKAKNLQGSLEGDFNKYLDIDNAWVTYSGTTAFYLILETLKEISPKKTVIIPSFICPLVPLAVKKAGLKVEVCDINAGDFDFNLAELENICAQNKDILAIVAVHLGGIPVDLDVIQGVAQKYGIFLVEDCAQSLGAEYKGKKTGAFGDFSFFSLCRGKGLTIYEGGVLVARKGEYAPLVANKIKQLIKDDFFSEGLKILELFGYWMIYRPRAFWFAYRLPQIFWNLQGKKFKAAIEYFSEDFPTHNVSRLRRRIGHAGFCHLENEIDRQRERAGWYNEAFKAVPGIKILQEPANTRVTYPYVVALFADARNRRRFWQKAEPLGLGVGQIYSLPITEYDYLKYFINQKECSGARSFAERHVTFSCSIYLEKRDVRSILAMVKSL